MGLPGLLCAKLGAATVLLTDYEPVVVRHLASNVALNGVQQRCTCLALDWFDLAPLAPAQRGVYDLLLLADVIYAEAVVRPLAQTLLALLKPTGALLLARWRPTRVHAMPLSRPRYADAGCLCVCAAGVALVAHRIRRPLVFDRVDRIARLQVRTDRMDPVSLCVTAIQRSSTLRRVSPQPTRLTPLLRCGLDRAGA